MSPLTVSVVTGTFLSAASATEVDQAFLRSEMTLGRTL